MIVVTCLWDDTALRPAVCPSGGSPASIMMRPRSSTAAEFDGPDNSSSTRFSALPEVEELIEPGANT